MNSIVFIQDTCGFSWVVKCNKIGNTKGIISKSIDAGYIVYQICLIKSDGFLEMHVFDELSEAQSFFLQGDVIQ